LRSEDAGEHLARVVSTRGPMLGFALSDDGRTVWVAGPDDGVLRSDDGGRSFARVGDLGALCLRFHAGVLWACADWARTGYALGRSRDGGRSFEPVLRFEEIAGAFDCREATEGHDRCVSLFPALRQTLTRVPDVVTPPLDAGLDASSTPPLDAGLDASSTPPQPAVSCGCATRRAGGGVIPIGLYFALVVARRRRAVCQHGVSQV
jgi:hypothetical protein